MKFTELLSIHPGIVSIIGSGGKTSLIYLLAEKLPGKKILCTTTRIFPFSGYRLLTDRYETIPDALTLSSAVCCGTPAENGKLSAPGLSISDLSQYADYTLVEADGSKKLPLKAHRPFEPVIPPGSGTTLCVVGCSGFSKPIREVCHCPEIFCEIASCMPDDPCSPELLAKVLKKEITCDYFIFNQAEDNAAAEKALETAAILQTPCLVGSIKEDSFQCLF